MGSSGVATLNSSEKTQEKYFLKASDITDIDNRVCSIISLKAHSLFFYNRYFEHDRHFSLGLKKPTKGKKLKTSHETDGKALP